MRPGRKTGGPGRSRRREPAPRAVRAGSRSLRSLRGRRLPVVRGNPLPAEGASKRGKSLRRLPVLTRPGTAGGGGGACAARKGLAGRGLLGNAVYPSASARLPRPWRSGGQDGGGDR